MPRTLIDVTFAVEHAEGVTDDELHAAMEVLKGSIRRDTLNLVQSKHWIHGYLANNPDGLLAIEPVEVWVKGPC